MKQKGSLDARAGLCNTQDTAGQNESASSALGEEYRAAEKVSAGNSATWQMVRAKQTILRKKIPAKRRKDAQHNYLNTCVFLVL